MDELFRKFCYYYITRGDQGKLEMLKLEADYNKEVQKKAMKFVKNLRQRVRKLGFDIDFESFCELLEEYINVKDAIKDEEKAEYLKVLVPLSQIYEINLREELERYISVEEQEKEEEYVDEEKARQASLILRKLCRYSLNNELSAKKLNYLIETAQKNNIDFKELENKVKGIVDEIKILTNMLGFGTCLDDLYAMVKDYLYKVNEMSDKQKVNYLKILMYLSDIYNINLKDLFNGSVSKKSKNVLQNLSNPLDDKELMVNILRQRYESGSFNIEDIVLKEDYIIKNNKYDYNKFLSKFIFRLLSIFLDDVDQKKYNELNKDFLKLINDDDIVLLKMIDDTIIKNIIEDVNKNELPRYICKKYKLTENVYSFIRDCIDAYNFKDGKVSSISLFNGVKVDCNIGIFIKGSEDVLLNIAEEYIVYCIDKGMAYSLKLNHDNGLEIHLNVNNIDYVVNRLDKIIKEKDLNKFLGVPEHMTGRIDGSLYGIVSLNNIDYTVFINDLLEVAYYRVLAKLVSIKINNEKDLKVIKNFICLNDVTVKKDLLCSELTYRQVEFESIKDIINKYIPEVSKTMTIYMDDVQRHEEILSEFVKSIKYISNIYCGKDKKEENNFVLNLL